jgi:hypothetical protein
MKVYIGKYRNHWISPYTVLEKVFFWQPWAQPDGPAYPEWVDRWADRLTPISQAIQSVLERVYPRVEYVKIDPWDVWSMDYTLAEIIVPMLRQLQANKQGAPYVDPEDVPEHLRPKKQTKKQRESGEVDSTHFERWEWTLGEMIWAFEQKTDDSSQDQFYDHSAVDPGRGISDQIGQIRVDKAGLTAWHQRKTNGFRLFGKYYEALWD